MRASGMRWGWFEDCCKNEFAQTIPFQIEFAALDPTTSAVQVYQDESR